MKSSRRWFLSFLVLWILCFAVLGGFTVWVDPYFHYHKPLEGLQYPINNERYQNDGILKNFDYNAIITGTSMTQNFRTSEFDQLFGLTSVKVPLAGASYKEVNDELTIALEHNPNIELVLRVLDYTAIEKPKDCMFGAVSRYPYYLYDDFLFNDVEYIFNKTVLFEGSVHVLEYTGAGGMTTSFDEYSNWNAFSVFGKEAIGAEYLRPDRQPESVAVTDEDYTAIRENITQNVTDLIAQYPDVQFYLFFPPYSIYYWDSQNQSGLMDKHFAEEKYVIEMLLEHDNIHLFSFTTEYDIICDLDNYKDIWHYSEDINSQILVWMSEGTHELTRENYLEYCGEEYDFYINYDYDALFE